MHKVSTPETRTYLLMTLCNRRMSIATIKKRATTKGLPIARLKHEYLHFYLCQMHRVGWVYVTTNVRDQVIYELTALGRQMQNQLGIYVTK